MLSVFAALEFDWPPELMALFNAFSLAAFNLELLAPECSFTVNYEAKWMVTQLLPVTLFAAVGIVLVCTRLLQWVQRTVFHVLPFGALAEANLVDVCIGVTISGMYYLYFRTYWLVYSCDMLCVFPLDLVLLSFADLDLW